MFVFKATFNGDDEDAVFDTNIVNGLRGGYVQFTASGDLEAAIAKEGVAKAIENLVKIVNETESKIRAEYIMSTILY